jgi:hypothetical protein
MRRDNLLAKGCVGKKAKIVVSRVQMERKTVTS